MGTAADLQSEWARLVVHSFVQAGVRDAVISPGSRSTPFTVAALEQKSLRCISALDERSAAHYALGQARASGRPSLLVCTSGSAAANYFPAVIEASEAGVPLVVLSADRPPDLLQCGANQTTDQIGLYGRHVRFFAQLGEPRASNASLRAARRLATRAAFEAVGTRPGPVHLNAPARKPLEPSLASGADAEAHARVDAIIREPLVAMHAATGIDEGAVKRVARAIDSAARPMVVCGPAPVQAPVALRDFRRLADRAKLVFASEASGQLRFGPNADLGIGSFDTLWRTRVGSSALVPDFVLQFGANPTSKGWEDICSAHRVRRAVVHPWDWVDPRSSAEVIVRAPIGDFVRALARESFDGVARDKEFVSKLNLAEQLVWDAAAEVLRDAGDLLTEAAIARAVRELAPERSAVVLGNSLPIRNFDTWVPPGGPALRVFAQRGVSGIDGIVSGGAGVASCVREATAVLVGDVSFLHDMNGLQLASQTAGPLIIVVVNNRGGRIFEQLPIGRLGKEEWIPYFTTPHDASVAGAASVYGCAFDAAGTVSELRAVLESAYARDGCTVVEAVVPPHGSAEQNRALRSAVDQSLKREGF